MNNEQRNDDITTKFLGLQGWTGIREGFAVTPSFRTKEALEAWLDAKAAR